MHCYAVYVELSLRIYSRIIGAEYTTDSEVTGFAQELVHSAAIVNQSMMTLTVTLQH